ncbi:MAG: hypothetical protein N2315_08630 [Thermanaerothrix sp.]|nr:hypothetical protein [Thermanaerothrix sp.]
MEYLVTDDPAVIDIGAVASYEIERVRPFNGVHGIVGLAIHDKLWVIAVLGAVAGGFQPEGIHKSIVYIEAYVALVTPGNRIRAAHYPYFQFYHFRV